ncbi:unnamed protein product [Bursaphelenchus okinawaensis]|uniref:Uncharacterized protein n=1 Tax=Bursaphelenchus okinawaensis TaxID=465554 RepID=A0A811LLN4_9BILA|nr:unnamed protein product [Bursaphelenchus okinawaensis]CAG9124716.1 unnamed protein product [Bursaphelenchus okinawaensis]
MKVRGKSVQYERINLLSNVPQQPRNSLNSEIAQSTSFTNDTQKRQSSSAFTAMSAGSSFQCDNFPCSAEDRAYYELEQALQYPVLPPNPHFFCCFDKFHITTVSKVLCLVYILFYGLLCYISLDPNHAVAFLISFLVAISVGCCLMYAVFQWSKMCLIPFFLLQTMLILYTLVWMIFMVYAALNPGDSYVFKEMHETFNNWLGICTQLWCWIVLAALAIFFAFLAYSALLFWYEYQFIAEVDHFLKSIRKSSSNASKENHETQNGASRLQL